MHIRRKCCKRRGKRAEGIEILEKVTAFFFTPCIRRVSFSLSLLSAIIHVAKLKIRSSVLLRAELEGIFFKKARTSCRLQDEAKSKAGGGVEIERKVARFVI